MSAEHKSYEADVAITIKLRVLEPIAYSKSEAEGSINDWILEQLPAEWLDNTEVKVSVNPSTERRVIERDTNES